MHSISVSRNHTEQTEATKQREKRREPTPYPISPQTNPNGRHSLDTCILHNSDRVTIDGNNNHFNRIYSVLMRVSMAINCLYKSRIHTNGGNTMHTPIGLVFLLCMISTLLMNGKTGRRGIYSHPNRAITPPNFRKPQKPLSWISSCI